VHYLPAVAVRAEIQTQDLLDRLAAVSVGDALDRLGSGPEGLTHDEALRRLQEVGPNALRSHGAEWWRVLVNQLRSSILLLLVAAAVVSIFVGDNTEAVIILVIVGVSVVLGFVNEYRSEQAVEALHAKIERSALVVRDGHARNVAVTDLVPGDIVELRVGDVVPADLRLVAATSLECDESVLTGESVAARKAADAPPGAGPLDRPSCVFMGTVVRAGAGRGVVAATGGRTVFGRVALRLGERHEQTAFQLGLRDFTRLLLWVGGILTTAVFVINVVLDRGILEAALFSLAIAVGITPQLLPAIVTVSLATGASRLAERKVIVKRLVCIEDLGNVDVLFTDKTGTLTDGRIAFDRSLDPSGVDAERPLLLGLLCNEATTEDDHAVGGNALDRALWDAPAAAGVETDGWRRLALRPFDHERQMASVLVERPDGDRVVIVKGAPEVVLRHARSATAEPRATLDRLFTEGRRVVAVATRGIDVLDAESERDLELAGFLTFHDPPKADVGDSVARLAALGVDVKIVTGDNGRVAESLCDRLGIPRSGTLTGAELDAMDGTALAAALPATSIFARVTPEQKSQIIRAQRALGSTVGFLGDGVNDAIALHDADVGISVDQATDVAKDAADIVLLDKDLGIIGEGVTEGRRIFANTIKYVLMGTSSNFGNMFSAAGASLFLSFLPMLPAQILLNNLLYDSSQLTIPTDRVDAELLARPSQWDVGFIRRFMLTFGPVSSIYDFMTFGVMLWVFDAGEPLFQSGWFVESLATQTLIILAIRTRRSPFWRSTPSRPLLVATLACVAIGTAIPFVRPFADALSFTAPPLDFLGVLVAMVVTYIGLVEVAKRRFFRPVPVRRPLAPPERRIARRVHRVAARWSLPGRVRRRRLGRVLPARRRGAGGT
jgi:Mg2+-importing ATPase